MLCRNKGRKQAARPMFRAGRCKNLVVLAPQVLVDAGSARASETGWTVFGAGAFDTLPVDTDPFGTNEFVIEANAIARIFGTRVSVVTISVGLTITSAVAFVGDAVLVAVLARFVLNVATIRNEVVVAIDKLATRALATLRIIRGKDRRAKQLGIARP